MIDYGKPVRDTMVVNVSRDAKHPREMTDDRHVYAGPQPRVTGQSTPPRDRLAGHQIEPRQELPQRKLGFDPVAVGKVFILNPDRHPTTRIVQPDNGLDPEEGIGRGDVLPGGRKVR